MTGSAASERVAASIDAWLWPSRRRPWAAWGVQVALVGVGFWTGFSPLKSLIGFAGVSVLSAVAIVLVIGAAVRGGGRGMTVVRVGARVLVVILLGFVGYEAISLGAMLIWAVSGPVAAVWLLLVGWTMASHATPRLRIHVPFVLPLGAWVGACAYAWMGELGVARCDDYRQTVTQPSVRILVESSTALATCTPGTHVVPRWHPRKLFVGEDGTTMFATMQRVSTVTNAVTDAFSGGLCAITLGSDAEDVVSTTCREDLPGLYALAVLEGRAQLLIGGSMGLLRVSAHPPFETLATAADGRYVSTLVRSPGDPELVLAFDDEMDRAERFDVETLRRRGSRELPIAPEEVRYDEDRREGVYCSASTPLFPIDGRPYLALAVGEDLEDVRLLGADAPWAWLAFSDGCDVDLDQRVAYVGVGTLGLLAVLDYDSGALIRTHWIGFGVRPLLFAAERRRLYAGSYLDGWVREVDVATGDVTRRWFVGRFVRHLIADPRDDTALLATSTLGVLRIDLEHEGGAP